MFIVRIIAGDRIAYWNGSWWAAEVSGAAHYDDCDAAHEAAVAADRVSGPPAGMSDGGQVEIVQIP